MTEKAGLAGKGWGGDVAVFDFDDDGYPDLFVTNMFGASQLYRNNGDGTFTDVTKEYLGRTSFGAHRLPRRSTSTTTAGSTCSSWTCTRTCGCRPTDRAV